jgi:IS1 family transposase
VWLEIDEFWTFVGSKTNKQWLIYAYDREGKEIVAYVFGDRSKKTANKLRKKLEELGITYDRIATDNWDAFIVAFSKNLTNAKHDIGKQYTNGIEGNNCLLRHRMRRVFRKTCCFSKIMRNHIKALEMTIFYFNYAGV